MIEFTKGPFTVVDTSWSTALIVRPDGRAIAVLSIEGDETLNEETEQALHDRQLADAQRFAAVDELYAALKAQEAWEADVILNADWSSGRAHLTQAQHDALTNIQNMRNAALAKARGEIERS